MLAAVIHWWQERDRLARALLLSVAIHLLLYGTWSFGNRYHLWQHRFLPRWLFPVKDTADLVKDALKHAEQERQIPLVFVDVTPAQATPEAPKDAQYYSSRNSRAANPTRDTESDKPKITGEQVKVFKTVDVEKTQAKPLQPTVPPPKPVPPVEPQKEQPKAEPRPSKPVGDLAMNRPSTNPRDAKGDAEKPQKEQRARERPRTLAEARAMLGIQGPKVKQSGGVGHIENLSSVNAKATPFGNYDAALIAAVQSYWYGLIDQRHAYGAVSGRVVIEFRLHPDGRVDDVKITDQSVGDLLSLYCQRAITGAAPFGPWPSDMRHLAGNYRDVRFVFYYN